MKNEKKKKFISSSIKEKTLKEEIKRRKTFGVISHPDAGKTTLTEKLLLFGGAIQEAGAVKNNKIKKTATSDFMELERQRGISISTSVLSFEYKGNKINILDTPGHKDFAEDTFRTLTAVDSVIVVIDVTKGVEEQTERLVEVCRMRKIPILVFINKLDREGKDAFDLLDEIEKKLGLRVTPLSWPIGMGSSFQGVYNLREQSLLLFSGQKKQKIEEALELKNLNGKILDEFIGSKSANLLRQDLEIIHKVYSEFYCKSYMKCDLHPVFFGSALNNFGIRELLDVFMKISPGPSSKESEQRMIKPNEKFFSGFVFKIHANMDPKHRDRIAFVKIASGVFRRNTPYFHVRLRKKFKYANPNAFFADKKKIIQESFAGDIIGLHDTGNFKIGDTLTEGEILHFKGIPNFSPEHFRYINNADPMKAKQLEKGIRQLMEEGVAQLFSMYYDQRKIIGTVGILQYEVIQYRLKHEYGAHCTYETLPVYKACWIEVDDEKHPDFQEFKRIKQRFIARDKENQMVFLADSAFSIQIMKEKYPFIKLRFTSEKILP